MKVWTYETRCSKSENFSPPLWSEITSSTKCLRIIWLATRGCRPLFSKRILHTTPPKYAIPGTQSFVWSDSPSYSQPLQASEYETASHPNYFSPNLPVSITHSTPLVLLFWNLILFCLCGMGLYSAASQHFEHYLAPPYQASLHLKKPIPPPPPDQAVLFYPGALNHLILFLHGRMTAEEIVEVSGTGSKEAPAGKFQ